MNRNVVNVRTAFGKLKLSQHVFNNQRDKANRSSFTHRAIKDIMDHSWSGWTKLNKFNAKHIISVTDGENVVIFSAKTKSIITVYPINREDEREWWDNLIESRQLQRVNP